MVSFNKDNRLEKISWEAPRISFNLTKKIKENNKRLCGWCKSFRTARQISSRAGKTMKAGGVLEDPWRNAIIFKGGEHKQ
jgi:hypothetical protein